MALCLCLHLGSKLLAFGICGIWGQDRTQYQYLGTDGVSTLIDALKDESAPVRRAAARALGRLAAAARQAEPALIEAINDPEATVRQSAPSALSRIREQ